MFEEERLIIINELQIVFKGILSIDEDSTVCKSLEKVYHQYGENYKLYFANGGDQINDECPEANICNRLGIGLIDGLGDKIQSSSWLLKK